MPPRARMPARFRSPYRLTTPLGLPVVPDVYMMVLMALLSMTEPGRLLGASQRPARGVQSFGRTQSRGACDSSTTTARRRGSRSLMAQNTSVYAHERTTTLALSLIHI